VKLLIGFSDSGPDLFFSILKNHTKVKNYYTAAPNIVMVMNGEKHRQSAASEKMSFQLHVR
jgi:hypothetical protein